LSILTKICIVVLVVLILLACPIFITQATVAPNYKQAYQMQVDKTRAAQQTARAAQISAQRANDTLAQLREDLSTSQAQKLQEIRQLRGQIKTLELANSGLQKQLSEMTTDLKRLSSTLESNVEQREYLSKQNTDLQQSVDRLRDQSRQLTQSLATTQGERDRLERQARLLKEQIASLEQQITEQGDTIERLQGQLASAGGGQQAVEGVAEAPLVQTADRITGTIQAVQEGMASINVGAAQGVKAGMQLMIYRGQNFVGWLRVEEVDTNEAAGTIKDAVLDPMRGDRVATPAGL
jgi:chromosome segregation ATPase